MNSPHEVMEREGLVNPIRTEFGVHGHWLRQIWRKGDVAIYERSLSKDKPAHELELVVITVKKERLLPNGQLIAAHEHYPSDSEWGRLGWSIPVRYQDLAFKLAAQCSGNLEDRSGFMRRAMHDFWLERKIGVVMGLSRCQ